MTIEQVMWLEHEFHPLPHRSRWAQHGGIYIFAGVNAESYWFPLYVGKTENLRERIPSHDRWEEAVQLGATHVHARVEVSAEARTALETLLIQALRPPMNVQLQPEPPPLPPPGFSDIFRGR